MFWDNIRNHVAQGRSPGMGAYWLNPSRIRVWIRSTSLLSTGKSESLCERLIAPCLSAIFDIIVKMVVGLLRGRRGDLHSVVCLFSERRENGSRCRLCLADVRQFAFQHSFLSGEVVDEQFAFDMVTMLNDTGLHPIVIFFVKVPVIYRSSDVTLPCGNLFRDIFECSSILLRSLHSSPSVRTTGLTNAFKSHYVSPYPFFILHGCSVNHKHGTGFSNLWSGKAHAIGVAYMVSEHIGHQPFHIYSLFNIAGFAKHSISIHDTG